MITGYIFSCYKGKWMILTRERYGFFSCPAGYKRSMEDEKDCVKRIILEQCQYEFNKEKFIETDNEKTKFYTLVTKKQVENASKEEGDLDFISDVVWIKLNSISDLKIRWEQLDQNLTIKTIWKNISWWKKVKYWIKSWRG